MGKASRRKRELREGEDASDPAGPIVVQYHLTGRVYRRWSRTFLAFNLDAIAKAAGEGGRARGRLWAVYDQQNHRGQVFADGRAFCTFTVREEGDT